MLQTQAVDLSSDSPNSSLNSSFNSSHYAHECDETEAPMATSRPLPLNHTFAKSNSNNNSEVSSLTESESDSLSLASINKASNDSFNEATWAEAYVSSAPHNPSLGLESLPKFNVLKVDLDWDDEGDLGSLHVEKSPKEHTESITEPHKDQEKDILSPLDYSRFPSHHKRFSDPHISSSSSLSMPSGSPVGSYPRRTSASVTTSPILGSKINNHHTYIPCSPKNKLKGIRRYSHATTCISSGSEMDHDDRFISIITTHLKELDDWEATSKVAIQESIQHISPPKRNSFLSSLLGTSSSSASTVSSTNDLNTNSKHQPHSPLVSFISRAFGPRRSLQHHRRPTSHVPPQPLSQQTPIAIEQQQQQRASMPHISWSSWTSSNTSKRSSRASSVSSLSHIPSSSSLILPSSPLLSNPTTTTKETRTKLSQALKLFEMGATEAAFATFRACFQESGNPFAEYCVAVCLVHGYGCSGSGEEVDAGMELLKELKGRGVGVAIDELEGLEED
ncbi:UNVERIFIED_CONTAM: hypothetical protein HDU68_001313 [Siphonaria sp. JEL0065]|nr:hypothetical protein HDU68_001313 [Siphonaria sp. JEL0065]